MSMRLPAPPTPVPAHYDPGTRVHVLHQGTPLPGRVLRRKDYILEVTLDEPHPATGTTTWVGSLLVCTLITK
ncbi:MAG TPA: hypothetical protein PKE21_13725 [Flavobacteriales bacterium]|nr:hypothetical protein [Flavobacteriales bacterium]HMR28536.1 hypothetical protein [Flavobacteriales bacterium]